MAATDALVSETQAASVLASLPAARRGGYLATATVIRSTGGGAWRIDDIGKIQQFFLGRFGRSAPVSAFGQTTVHNQLGYDHRNAVDIALHPDSLEGRALIGYLRSQGIPFLAFRGAIPGVATAAHIHVGYPSHRR